MQHLREPIPGALAVGAFFFLSFLLVGTSIGFSVLFAILGALATGWIAASWKHTEIPVLPERETPQEENSDSTPEDTHPKATGNFTREFPKKHQQRRNSIFFWKNPRSSKHKSKFKRRR